MRRSPETLFLVLLLGLATAQAGCQSPGRRWTEPEEHRVKVVSDAGFLRTDGGDYVDGYFAEYESDFQRHRIFMALELVHYVKGDRLFISGRLSGDFVRMPSGDQAVNRVPVFEVEKAKPDVPKSPDIPAIK